MVNRSELRSGRINLAIHYLSYLFFGSVGAIISTVGDFFESKIKRLNNKKDSSNIIPGHGGLLDRLDSAIFISPFLYLFLRILKHVS